MRAVSNHNRPDKTVSGIFGFQLSVRSQFEPDHLTDSIKQFCGVHTALPAIVMRRAAPFAFHWLVFEWSRSGRSPRDFRRRRSSTARSGKVSLNRFVLK